MATNGDAINDLEASKKALEDQCNGASGTTFLKLLTSIQHIADEVGKLEVLTLNDAYTPQTTAFQNGTADAIAFVQTLNSLRAIFGAVAGLAAAVDKVISYIK